MKMSYTYNSVRPLTPERYNFDRFNPVLVVEQYWGQKEVYDGWLSWGHVTFKHALDSDMKKLFGLFDAGDVMSDKKLDKRIAKIAKKVSAKIGVKQEHVFNDLRPVMAAHEEVRSLSNRSIVYHLCCAYMGIQP